MRVIGVIDLMDGRAVHARAGRRDEYGPVQTAAGAPIASGDAVALACAYRERLGINEVYIADLDAIMGAPRQDDVVRAIAAVCAELWLDAGITSVASARDAIDLGAARAVVGLETLQSYDALAAICAGVGGQRVAFSLDLRDGEPMRAAGAAIAREPAEEIATRAGREGAGSMIVIDLARVGTRSGPDLALIGRIRRAVPHATLLAGGGVRGLDDLRRLADAGCDGALVATALHDGSLERGTV